MAELGNGNRIPYGPDRKTWGETLSKLAMSPDGQLLVSPPSEDPADRYPVVPGITSAWYQVPSTGIDQEQQSEALSQTTQFFKEEASNCLGWQASIYSGFSFGKFLNPDVVFPINNGGDPFTHVSPYPFNTKWMEQNVLDYYASLWHAKWPHNPKDPETYHGYVLTMGSTEGIILPLWNARDYLSGKYVSTVPLQHEMKDERPRIYPCAQSEAMPYIQAKSQPYSQNVFTPVVFYSADSNFVLPKTLRMLGMYNFSQIGTQDYPDENPLGGNWPLVVPSNEGRIDIEALAVLVDFFSAKGHPIIVNFNYGTTFQGAYDDVKSAGEILVPILKKNNMYERKVFYNPDDPGCYVTRKGFWFHVDGALGASYMPFVEMAIRNRLINEKPDTKFPVFDFRLDFVSSIVTSGHKWIGTPWPCGIYMTRTGLLLQASGGPEYLISPNSTLGTSRNGHSSLLLWLYISRNSFNSHVSRITRALELVDYAIKKLKDLELELQDDLCIFHSPFSLAVCFRQPNKHITRKYWLVNQSVTVDGKAHDYSHIYVMDGTSKEQIDQFIEDLHAPGAFPPQV